MVDDIIRFRRAGVRGISIHPGGGCGRVEFHRLGGSTLGAGFGPREYRRVIVVVVGGSR